MGIFNHFSSAGNSREESSGIEASNILSQEAERLERISNRHSVTLEAVTSRVMVVDQGHEIVSVNASAMHMMREAEQDLKQALPTFSAECLVGNSIDVFDANSALQHSVLDDLTVSEEARIEIGKRTFDLVISPLFDENNARLGTVVEWSDVSKRLAEEELGKSRLAEEALLAQRNSRIRSALNVVTSNVMLANDENIITYVNESVIAMLTAAESDIKRELPNFSVSSLVGQSVDIFYKNPAHQVSMLKELKDTFRTQIVVGGRTFSLIANPVFSAEGGRIGTVVEWQDNTLELAFENVVKDTIEQAIKGNLDNRIDSSGLSGFLGNISNGINDLLTVFGDVMSSAADSIGSLATGNLTQRIDKEYEGSYNQLKTDVNMTIDKLVEVVTEIGDGAQNVKSGSNEIASGNANLSQRTEEQAASLEQTSAAMEEITMTVQQNAANAVQANTLAKGARETAENGGAVVSKAIEAMQAINASSTKINDIISVIDEIAFQTNLLALNAAVEAARAGDQGRGFAVVADEVRNLAGRSATAAKEIKELIKDSSEKVHEGSELVNKSGDTLEEIVTAVKKVNDIVAEISSASEEQSTGLDEVNRAVSQMDSMTQQNAALVEEAAAASESLGGQADALDQLISFFDAGNSKPKNSKQTISTEPNQSARQEKPRLDEKLESKGKVVKKALNSPTDNKVTTQRTAPLERKEPSIEKVKEAKKRAVPLERKKASAEKAKVRRKPAKAAPVETGEWEEF